MAATVQTDPSFNLVGAPRVLFRGKYVSLDPEEGNPWDIHPDGKRFLMMKEIAAATAAEGPRRIHVVLNWFEELKQRVPVK